jgi:hypothetical protein
LIYLNDQRAMGLTKGCRAKLDRIRPLMPATGGIPLMPIHHVNSEQQPVSVLAGADAHDSRREGRYWVRRF